MDPASVTVGTSAVTIIAAKSSGYRFVMVSNKSTSNSIWLSFTGGTPTAANGYKLGIGDQVILTDQANPGSLQLGANGIKAISDASSQSVAVEYY